MGKHSAPRNNVVPARLAMLSTATLIGLAVSANGAAGQAIADDTNSTTTSGDGVWVAPPKPVLTAAPATYQQQSRPERIAPVATRRPAHRADRPAARPDGNAKPGMGAQPGGAAKPGTGAPLAAVVDALASGSAALPAPLRAVLEDLVKQVGPVLAKGLIELIANGNPPSPKARHAAPAPAAPAASVADDEGDADSGAADDAGFDAADDATDSGAADDTANFGAAGDDSGAADDDTADFGDDDSEATDDDTANFGAAGDVANYGAAGDPADSADTVDPGVPGDDAVWLPLSLGPSTAG
ncbi:hypothetical protein ACFWF7_37045 [Nocardia sp. NPDC060256]|uniref:hypothetical protein n=1 Tax=unclassified Nocardia TaxID=2637762 RepID=UPI0036658BF6